jgi:hypothetical protein
MTGRCLWRDCLTPSRNKRSGYTDERLRHHRTYGGASDPQLRWCDGTRSEVVGQLAGCRDALNHVVSAPTPAGSERGLAASMPALSALRASGKGCSCLSSPFMFLKRDAFLERPRNVKQRLNDELCRSVPNPALGCGAVRSLLIRSGNSPKCAEVTPQLPVLDSTSHFEDRLRQPLHVSCCNSGNGDPPILCCINGMFLS